MNRKKNQGKAATRDMGSDYLRGQAEFANHYHVARRTVSDWQARKIVPFLKLGRKCILFRKSDVDAALSKFEVSTIG